MNTVQAKDIIERHIDQLADNRDSRHSEELIELLSKMTEFQRYSLGNVLLIMA